MLLYRLGCSVGNDRIAVKIHNKSRHFNSEEEEEIVANKISSVHIFSADGQFAMTIAKAIEAESLHRLIQWTNNKKRFTYGGYSIPPSAEVSIEVKVFEPVEDTEFAYNIISMVEAVEKKSHVKIHFEIVRVIVGKH